MSPLVDTLQATRQLEKAGFAAPQAEAIVTIVAHAGTRLATKADIERLQAATKTDIERLQVATKADIERLQAATKTDIERVEASTKKDIQGLRTELTAKMDTKIAEVRSEIAEVRTDISALRAELVAMMNKQASNQRMVMIAALGLLFVALRFT